MPQYRKLYVKTTESLDINEMPDDFTRLLWVLLPLAACREGRGIDNPAWIKAKSMPLREDVTHKMIDAAMAWYVSRGMIQRYTVDGRGYFQIVNWSRYQGDTSREAESNYPGQDQENTITNSRPTLDLLTTNSCSDADANTEVEKPSPKPKRTPKPKVEIPPAIAVYRENAQRFPHKTLYQDITGAVGDDPAKLKFWGDVVKAYIAQGWNPSNIAVMLDYFKRGEIPGPKANGNGKPASTGWQIPGGAPND